MLILLFILLIICMSTVLLSFSVLHGLKQYTCLNNFFIFFKKTQMVKLSEPLRKWITDPSIFGSTVCTVYSTILIAIDYGCNGEHEWQDCCQAFMLVIHGACFGSKHLEHYEFALPAFFGKYQPNW